MPLLKKSRKSISQSHTRAPKQERELADRIGGKRVKGSGAGFEKGDVRLSRALKIECKCTKHKSYALHRDIVEKIIDEAMPAGEFPAMHIEYLNDQGQVDLECAVVPVWVLELMGIELTDARS